MELRRRAVAAATVLLLGLAFCFVMYWWQLRYPYAARGFGFALFAAIPFGGLALMVIGGMSRVATVLGWLVLAVLTAGAYIGSATSSSSTSALIWLAPFIYGTIVLSILFALDSILRASKLSLRAWRDWRRDDRRL